MVLTSTTALIDLIQSLSAHKLKDFFTVHGSYRMIELMSDQLAEQCHTQSGGERTQKKYLMMKNSSRNLRHDHLC